MNRRDFLKSLFAVGVMAGLPLPVGVRLADIEWAFLTRDSYQRHVFAYVTFRDGGKQVFVKDAVISGCQMVTSRDPGRKNALAYQCAKRTRELARDVAVSARHRAGLPLRGADGRHLWREETEQLFQEALIKNWSVA